jgi:hypothetical protein
MRCPYCKKSIKNVMIYEESVREGTLTKNHVTSYSEPRLVCDGIVDVECPNCMESLMLHVKLT